MTPEEIEKLPYRPCVGIMLMNEAGRIFVGRRKDTAALAWQMPQGGIDPGEGSQEAALRELWEETGVTPDLVEVIGRTSDWVTYDLPPELLGKVWKGKYRGQKQMWFLMRFIGTDDRIDIETAHPEFSEWTWLDPGHLVESIGPFKRDVYVQVVEHFSGYFG